MRRKERVDDLMRAILDVVYDHETEMLQPIVVQSLSSIVRKRLANVKHRSIRRSLKTLEKRAWIRILLERPIGVDEDRSWWRARSFSSVNYGPTAPALNQVTLTRLGAEQVEATLPGKGVLARFEATMNQPVRRFLRTRHNSR